VTDYSKLATQYEQPRIAGLLSPGQPSVERLLEQAGLSVLPMKPPLDAVDASLRRLVALASGADPLRYTVVRSAAKALLAELKIRDAARLVNAAFPLEGAKDETPPPPPPDALPWGEPVDGASLLDAIAGYLKRLIILPSGGAETLVAFIVMTYVVVAFDTVPYVLLSSPTKRCGKTRLLEVLNLLVYRPWHTVVVTGPVLFRKIEAHHPTLLLDEAEVVRGRGEGAEIVRQILHAGYKRGATVARCVGEDNEVHEFDTFGPKVFALIGRLPPTLFDRCIQVRMARRHRGEPLERFRERIARQETSPLCRQLMRWAEDHSPMLRQLTVSPPEFLDDRAFEVWEPLLAIGMAAGNGWQERLLAAARTLSGTREDEDVGPLLLDDLYELFTTNKTDRLETVTILETLNARDDRPWAEGGPHGKPLTPHALARVLRPFGVAPTTIRIAGRTAKGYRAEQFIDLWPRYAPRAATPTQPAPILDDSRYPTPVVGHPAVTGKPAPALERDGVTPAITERQGNPLDGAGHGDAREEPAGIDGEAPSDPPPDLVRQWAEAPVGEQAEGDVDAWEPKP